MDQSPRNLRIRPARRADLPAIRAIYAHHVLSGVASFEERPPGPREMWRRWRSTVRKGLPYLVAEAGGEVLGYAYASPFRQRPAYRYTLEDSVYVASSAAGRGVGSALLAELVARCERLGYRRMIAVIGDSGNAASIALHRKLGFEQAGLLRAVGFKHGRWVDTVYMARELGEGANSPPDGSTLRQPAGERSGGLPCGGTRRRSRIAPLLLAATLAVGFLAADQASKYVARTRLRGSGVVRLAGGTVVLAYAENDGAFLGLGSQWPRWLKAIGLWIAPAVVVLLVAAWGVRRVLRDPRVSLSRLLAVALLVGGGTGNLVDRLLRDGRVTDFLNIGIGALRTGIFNLADFFLVLALVLLLLASLRSRLPRGVGGPAGRSSKPSSLNGVDMGERDRGDCASGEAQ